MRKRENSYELNLFEFVIIKVSKYKVFVTWIYSLKMSCFSFFLVLFAIMALVCKQIQFTTKFVEFFLRFEPLNFGKSASLNRLLPADLCYRVIRKALLLRVDFT